MTFSALAAPGYLASRSRNWPSEPNEGKAAEIQEVPNVFLVLAAHLYCQSRDHQLLECKSRTAAALGHAVGYK
jgi:hypothetical protein